MNIWGWAFMIFSWTLILGLMTYSFYRTLFSKEIDIEEGDMGQDLARDSS